eukprot:s943_g6.t1
MQTMAVESDMTIPQWRLPNQFQAESGGPVSARGLEVAATFRPPPGLEVASPLRKPRVQREISIPWFGSRGHPLACSRRCVKMQKSGGCTAGAACNYCHLDHAGNNAKPDKLQRRLMDEMPEQDRLAAFLPDIKDRVACIRKHGLWV